MMGSPPPRRKAGAPSPVVVRVEEDGSLFAVLITGEYPLGLRDFLVGVYRYNVRVQGYAGLLTDNYPPFDLKAG